MSEDADTNRQLLSWSMFVLQGFKNLLKESHEEGVILFSLFRSLLS